MCLILIAWKTHPDYPLVVAANRDEFYSRPSALAASWKEAPHVFGGRDLEAGGTWLGITSTKRFAAVTNFRDPAQALGSRSRGKLTEDFLLSTETPENYVNTIDGALFSGFNLFAGDTKNLYYTSNRGGQTKKLPPGIYGISNHLLDTPWPKLSLAKERFIEALNTIPEEAPFFTLLADSTTAPDEQLPSTGVALDWERKLSAVFIHSPGYGTRASTLLLCGSNGSATFIERSFDETGEKGEARLIIPAP